MPVFIDVDFVTLFQTLLLHGLPPAEKAELWSRFYRQRWVRFTGQLTYVKKDTLRFRQLGNTSTYDVFLRIARTSEHSAPMQLTVGRFYNYAGRLESYDDGFQTLYADQGVVRDAGPDGVPGVLATEPPLARHVPLPPSLLSPTPARPADGGSLPAPPG